MEQHDSVTTTRHTTRVLYVEEISDHTERRNSTYTSFEAENVEEVTKSSVVAAPRSPGKGPPPHVTQTLADITSPLKKMKPKNSVSPAEIIGVGKDPGKVGPGGKRPTGGKAIEGGNNVQRNNEKNAQGSQQGAGDLAKVDKGPPAKEDLTPVEQDVPNPNGEVPRDREGAQPPAEKQGADGGTGPAEGTPKDTAKDIPKDTTKDTPKDPSTGTDKQGDTPPGTEGVKPETGTASGTEGVEPQTGTALGTEVVGRQTGTAEVTLQNETLVQSLATSLMKGVATPAAANGGVPQGVQGVPPAPRDLEKGVAPPGDEDAGSPLPAMRTFSKVNSSSSMVSALSGGGGGAPGGRRPPGDDSGGGGEPPSRRSTRKNLLHMQKSKRAFANLEDSKTISESMLYQTLRPCLVFMKFTGIFFVRKKGQFGKSVREVARSCTPLQIYCLAMCFLLFLNFLRSMFAFDPNDGFTNKFFLKFLTAIFMYESSSRAALAYWHAYRKKKGLQEFFLTVEKICYSDSIIPYEQDLKNVMKAAIVISILVSLCNMGSNAYGMFGTASNQFDSYLIPISPQAPLVEVWKVFILVLVLFNGLVAMLSLSFFTLICYILYKEFEYLCRTFIMKIRDDGSFTDDLEKFRITHQKRCKLVEDADSMFKYYIANTYMTNVPLLCVLLYIIVYSEDDISYTIINAFRLFYVLVQMCAVSVAATMINNQAHAPLGDIYSIKVQAATTERQLEVNMFLNKLTGTQIGMTAWDMFVINKPTVLTVVGMVLTYFFLLVQFKNPLGEPTKCECMVNVSSDILRTLVSDATTEAFAMTTL